MESIEKIIHTTKSLLTNMGFDCAVEFMDRESLKLVSVVVAEKDSGVIIGKNGCNLDSLEHIVRLLVNKASNLPKVNFIIDINNYRQQKSSTLVESAKKTAERVIQTFRSEALQPMTSYERKLVHLELASYKNIMTESIGEGLRRRVVIKPIIATGR